MRGKLITFHKYELHACKCITMLRIITLQTKSAVLKVVIGWQLAAYCTCLLDVCHFATYSLLLSCIYRFRNWAIPKARSQKTFQHFPKFVKQPRSTWITVNQFRCHSWPNWWNGSYWRSSKKTRSEGKQSKRLPLPVPLLHQKMRLVHCAMQIGLVYCPQLHKHNSIYIYIY